MSNHIRFSSDNEYEPTDSEEENYTPHQRNLLKRVRTRDESESENENEVYALNSDSEQSGIALSDVEGQEDDDGIPNVHAWGKHRSQYYSTDYVDPDYGTYQGKDAELADLEEEEAKLLQKELLEQFAGDDFVLSVVKQTGGESKKESEITKLSKEEREDILIKESYTLIEELKGKMQIARDFLAPIITLSQQGKVADSQGLHFIKVYYETILKYHVNLNVYLLLQSSKINLTNHSILKRLYQWRQLFVKLDPIFNDVIKAQVEVILEKNKTKKILQVLCMKLELQEATSKKRKSDEDSKGVTFDPAQVDEIGENSDEEEDADNMGESRRAITYQIAKNKGLTPHRNKLQRNPRVKYRNKYRQAKIRRKGAVREVRTEMSRYAGELSGIKATVSKSIKIKS